MLFQGIVALLIGLAGPIAIIAAFIAISRARSLQQQISDLNQQLDSQSERLHALDRRTRAQSAQRAEVDTPSPVAEAGPQAAGEPAAHPAQFPELPAPGEAAPAAPTPPAPDVTPPRPTPPPRRTPPAPPIIRQPAGSTATPPVPPAQSPVSAVSSGAPIFRSTPARSSSDLDALEARIGGSWLNRIGVTLLVIGIAFALGYTLTHLGPLGKSLLAMAVSIALIVIGLLLERREGYAFYGRGLIAGGWAALYATAYAVHELPATRIVDSPRIGFILLLLVGAGMVVHSLRYRNQGLTGLAYGLAYAAIVLHSISTYTLLAATLLGLGTVLHLLRRRWYVVALGGIVATYGSLLLWYLRQSAISMQDLSLALGAVAIAWVVFLVADFAPEAKNVREQAAARAVALLNAVSAGGLTYLAWARSSADTAWSPLCVLGVLYITTSIALRHIARPTTHQIHSLAATLLLGIAAGLAFERTGATWAWLVEAQALVLIGMALRDRFHRMLGCTIFLAPMLSVVDDQIGARARRPDGLFDRDRFLLTAAACGGFYLTFARLKAFIASDPVGRVEERVRRGFSYAAFALILVGLWVQLPIVYVAPASVVLALILFELSGARELVDLRIQSHVASLWALLAALALTAPSSDRLFGYPARVPALIAVAVGFVLLFLRQRGGRRTVLDEDPQLRPFFSWAAAILVALTIWLEVRPVAVGPAWMIVALLFVETGIALKENQLRRPGYLILVAACASFVMSNLTATDRVAGVSIRAASFVPAIGAIYYLWWRLRALADPAAAGIGDRQDELSGRLFTYVAAGMLGLFVRFEFGLDGAALRWSLAMVALFVVGYLLRDADFRLQAYALAGAVAVRAVGYDFQYAGPFLGIDGPLAVAVVGVAAYVAAGFLIRGRVAAIAKTRRPDRRSVALESRLEEIGRDLMWLLGVAVAALYVWRAQSGSMLIVAWALEGLVASAGGFMFASRPLRLAGLGLLAIALGTTLVRAFTTFDTLGRIISFVVLGVVLLLISFVYTRYRERLRKVL
jgi:uncharacterized membrane protein